MKADYIYFGDSGLTSTSANHVANMAKESVRDVTAELGGVSFYGTTVSLLSGGEPKTAKVGKTTEELDRTYENLTHIGEAHALIAWLREAIKARERLLKEVKDMTLEGYCRDVLGGVEVPKVDVKLEDWLKERGLTMPDINGDFPDVEPDGNQSPMLRRAMVYAVSKLHLFCKKFGLMMPDDVKKEDAMTEDEYMASLSVKDRNRMLLLEAKAAVIGKYINENGTFSDERKKLRSVLANPVGTSGVGVNTLMYEFKPTVSLEYVDDMFFRLAAEHRALQAELNGMLAERQRTIEADQQAKAAAYQKACDDHARETSALQDKLNAYLEGERKRLSEYRSEYDQWMTEQKNRHQQLSADLAAWRLAEAKRIAGLGIVIPNELRPVYERVNGLGK